VESAIGTGNATYHSRAVEARGYLGSQRFAANFKIGDDIMLHWAVVFFVIALIAAVFGFGGIAANAAGIAQILFFIFLVLFVLSLIFGGLRGRPPV
jgi:uncharacterized membrane protein YtjA (UPF0391 family)